MLTDVTSALEEALGRIPEHRGPYVVEHTRTQVTLDGITLADYVAHADGNIALTISVADPVVRTFPHPVIAAHQTNECGRDEVFGIGGESHLAYGMALARRGHRVFGIDLRWTGARAANSPQWDFARYSADAPESSPLSSDCADFMLLIRLMRDYFGETPSINWVGHSHGGVNGYVMAALLPDRTFNRVVCNAAYAAFPRNTDILQFPNFVRYVRAPHAQQFWQNLDNIIALAATKCYLSLQCYSEDGILPYPCPDAGRIAELKSRNVDVVCRQDGHVFPEVAQGDAFEFLETEKLAPDTPLIGPDQRNEEKVSAAYFEDDEVWADTAEEYQHQLVELVKEISATGVTTVLDVGCGNGLITNRLPESLDVVALDLSATALRYVKHEKVQASICELPFADCSFDLVYCFDVIEHLPSELATQAILELQRVAKKHVLISVPLNEDIPANSVRCAECGTEYHVNGHLRTQDLQWLTGIPVSDQYARAAIFMSGDITVPPSNSLIDIYHGNNIYPQQLHMSCPHCGADSIQQPYDQEQAAGLKRQLDSVRSALWFDYLSKGFRWCDRSEGAILLTRKSSEPIHIPENASATSASGLTIDFRNRLQEVRTDFTSGSIWPRYLIGKGAQADENGVSLIDNDTHDSSPINIRFPVSGCVGDELVVHATGEQPGSISLFGIDGITGAVIRLLDHHEVAADDEIRVSLGMGWAPDRFGLAVDLYIYGPVRVQSVEYVPAVTAQSLTYAVVAPGFNVVRMPAEADIPIFWTYFSRSHGRLPLVHIALRLPNVIAENEFLVGEIARQRSHFKEWLALLYGSPIAVGSNLLPVDTHSDLDRMVAEELNRTREAVVSIDRQLASANELIGKMRSEADIAQSELATARVELATARVELATARDVIDSLADEKAALAHQLGRLTFHKPRQLLRWTIDGVRSPKVYTRKLLGRLFFQHGRLIPERALQFPPRWKEIGRVDVSAPEQHEGQRILVISHMFPHPDQPGLGSFVLEQVQALIKGGAQVLVVSGRPFWMTSHRNPVRLLGAIYNYLNFSKAAASKYWKVDGVPVVFLPYPILGPFSTHGLAYKFGLGSKLHGIASEFCPDVIHAHTAYLDGSAALALSRKMNIPYIITEHTGPFSTLMNNSTVRKFTLKALRQARRVITVSTALKRDILSYCSLTNTIVIPNVVDTERFNIGPNSRESVPGPRLLFVGYFVPVKNIPLLLDAFVQIRSKWPDATLTLVGGGETAAQEEGLRQQIEHLGLTAAITMRGYADRQEVARIMREDCDLFIMPSKSETFGCVVAEALASGKPAVVTPCGGPEDIVTADWMGEVCATMDPNSLAQSIESVLGRLDTFDPWRIRESAVSRFSAGNIARRLEDLYSEVLENKA